MDYEDLKPGDAIKFLFGDVAVFVGCKFSSRVYQIYYLFIVDNEIVEISKYVKGTIIARLNDAI